MRALAAAALLALVAPAASAWTGFYGSGDAPRAAAARPAQGPAARDRAPARADTSISAPRPAAGAAGSRPAAGDTSSRPASGDAGLCVRAILAAQERHGIPGNLLLGIGLQEAGTRRGGRLTVWPWAVNAAGEGRLFDTREAAMAWVRARREAGVRSIDVGCLQINLRWHPAAFASLEEGFDPWRNADYAARFLKSLHRKTGDWTLAAGSYHSFTPARRDVYLASLRRNLSAANARLDELSALAGPVLAAAPAAPQVRARPAPAPARAAPPLTGGFWAGWLSEGTGAERRSLYARRDLEPLLPRFASG